MAEFGKWTHVKKEMPEKWQKVIGYDEQYDQVGECQRAPWGDGRLIFHSSDDCSIQWWMPLPEPTKEMVTNE